MTVKLGINGFGRIGRNIFRSAQERKDIQVVAINDSLGIDYIAYMLKYDSAHGPFKGSIEKKDNYLIINNRNVFCFSEKLPRNIQWKDLTVDVVAESTGCFLSYNTAYEHIISGAKMVILTAPPEDEIIPMFVMGVNHKDYSGQKIISNSSCTTNCLAPLAMIINRSFGIIEALMTTVHSVTSNQKVVDSYSYKDWRSSRSALQNIIPTSTRAAKSLGKIIPELNNKLTGISFRVPTLNVSVVDINIRLKKSSTYNNICSTIKESTEKDLKNIMGYVDEDVVSTDFNGEKLISIFDANAGLSLNDKFVKLVSWYDNETGYSNKLLDLLSYIFSEKI